MLHNTTVAVACVQRIGSQFVQRRQIVGEVARAKLAGIAKVRRVAVAGKHELRVLGWKFFLAVRVRRPPPQ